MRYPTYPGYHHATNTGLHFPKDWLLKRLRFSAHTNPVRSEVVDWPDDRLVSFVPMDAVDELGNIDTSDERPIGDVYNGYTYFADGDVVVAKITPCFENGKGALARELANGVGFGTTEFHVLRAQPDVSPRWLLYLTRSHTFRKLGEAEMYGAGGQKRVPESFMRNFWAGVPELQEQEHIADFLDWKTGQIDALIAKKKRLLETIAQHRTRLITDCVAGSADWPRCRVRSFMNFLTSGSRGWAEHFADNGALFLRITNLQRGSTRLLLDDLQRVAPPDNAEGLRTKTQPGDLLVSITADLGSVAVIPDGMAAAYVSQHLALVRLQLDQVNPSWVAHSFLSSYGKFQLLCSSYGGTKVQLSLDDIKNFEVRLPPTRAEQDALLHALETTLDRLDRMRGKVVAAIAELERYRSALITAAVTGQIDVRAVKVPETV